MTRGASVCGGGWEREGKKREKLAAKAARAAEEAANPEDPDATVAIDAAAKKTMARDRKKRYEQLKKDIMMSKSKEGEVTYE